MLSYSQDRVRAREWTPFFLFLAMSILKRDKHICSALVAWLVMSIVTCGRIDIYIISMMQCNLYPVPTFISVTTTDINKSVSWQQCISEC